MASPHVAGGAALYLYMNPGESAPSVESEIKNAAVSTGTTSKDGEGIKREDVGGF